MNAAVFRFEHRVTYADCTVGNHVYYARYLDMLEEARGEFFRRIGWPLLRLQEAGLIFPVIECRLRYRAAARYDDVLAVELGVTQLGRVRLAFGCQVLRADGRLLVEGETIHACTSVADKLQRLPDDLRAALAPFLRAQRGPVGGESPSN